MVLVRATQRCFIDTQIREPGEVFDYTGTVTEKGPLQLADEPEPKPPVTVTRRGKKGHVPAPEWTTEGFRETHQNG